MAARASGRDANAPYSRACSGVSRSHTTTSVLAPMEGAGAAARPCGRRGASGRAGVHAPPAQPPPWSGASNENSSTMGASHGATSGAGAGGGAGGGAPVPKSAAFSRRSSAGEMTRRSAAAAAAPAARSLAHALRLCPVAMGRSKASRNVAEHPSRPGAVNDSSAHSSPKLFCTGVPDSTSRREAGREATHLKTSVPGFLSLWPSSHTTWGHAAQTTGHTGVRGVSMSHPVPGGVLVRPLCVPAFAFLAAAVVAAVVGGIAAPARPVRRRAEGRGVVRYHAWGGEKTCQQMFVGIIRILSPQGQ